MKPLAGATLQVLCSPSTTERGLQLRVPLLAGLTSVAMLCCCEAPPIRAVSRAPGYNLKGA